MQRAKKKQNSRVVRNFTEQVASLQGQRAPT